MHKQDLTYTKVEIENQLIITQASISVDSTIVQLSNWRLHKRQIDGYSCRIDGYINYFKY